jgi:thiol-disulfide isomerase/thioredoxin
MYIVNEIMAMGQKVSNAASSILFITNFIYLLAILVGAFLVYKFLVKPRLEHFESGNVFRMFHATWCGHCKEAKPEFDKIVSTTEIDGKPIKIEAIDVDKNKDLTTEFNVTSYPTFILVKDGKRIPYEGERKEQSFRNFLKQNL